MTNGFLLVAAVAVVFALLGSAYLSKWSGETCSTITSGEFSVTSCVSNYTLHKVAGNICRKFPNSPACDF